LSDAVPPETRPRRPCPDSQWSGRRLWWRRDCHRLGQILGRQINQIAIAFGDIRDRLVEFLSGDPGDVAVRLNVEKSGIAISGRSSSSTLELKVLGRPGAAG